MKTEIKNRTSVKIDSINNSEVIAITGTLTETETRREVYLSSRQALTHLRRRRFMEDFNAYGGIICMGGVPLLGISQIIDGYNSGNLFQFFAGCLLTASTLEIPLNAARSYQAGELTRATEAKIKALHRK